MLEYGILNKVEYEYYPADWHMHTDKEIVLEGLYKHFTDHVNPGYSLDLLDTNEDLKRGDFLTFTLTSKKVSNHAAIYMGRTDRGKQMLHCLNIRGVSLYPIKGYFSNKINKVFRVHKKDI